MVAALLLAVGGCGSSGSGDGGEGIAAVQPSQVTPDQLRSAVSDPRLVRFYEGRDWQPAWNAGSSQSLVEALRAASRHAIDPEGLLAGIAGAEGPAAREAALSLAALDYAQVLARGRVDPKRIFEVYEVPISDADLSAGLNQAIQQDNVPTWLAGLAPQDEEYRLLSEAYVAAARNAQGNPQRPIATGARIRPGASDPRMPQVVAALRAAGYLPAPAEGQAAAGGQGYAEATVGAVRQLQEDGGLEANGVIDDATIEALNRGAFDRARTLAVNLERRRWLPREAPPTRVDVNIASAMLAYVRDGALVDRRRVVVGQPGNETPELGSPMFRLVANPTWTVPQSIEEEEIAPKGEAYLRRNNMSRQNGRIVQESGPQNSLGLVKFDMKNDHAIYLHDTPAKALFDRPERHASHGCVRVHDALGFARMIAEQEGVLEEWERARATGEETFVALPREIPVRLIYHTAFVDGGRVRFRPDPYQWDEDVAEALGLPARPRRERGAHGSDVGP